MLLRIKMILIALTLTLPFLSPAQKQKKSDKLLLDNLITHIHYLADEKLEGRKTGSPGEKSASDYISIEFSRAGLQPKGDHNGWLQAFDIDEGRQINPDSYFSINDQPLLLNKEYFPLSFSASGAVSGSPAIALQEGGVPWFIDLKEMVEEGHGDPHFDLAGTVQAKVKEFSKKGATAVILYNTSRIRDNLRYNPKDRPEALPIPVFYLTREAKRKFLKDESASVDIKGKVGFIEKKRTGHNVVGYLDNGAPYTVIIAAHYNQLEGEDRNFPYEGPKLRLHRADDSAAGIAGIIELSKMLAVSKLKSNNYLFVAFSGDELELAGAKYFAAQPGTDPGHINYMIDLDKIGRVGENSRILIPWTYNSSPVWKEVCEEKSDKGRHSSLSINYGANAAPHKTPEDYDVFFQKSIPVLFFFTGWRNDSYSGPEDGADKINYAGEIEVLKFIYDIVKTVDNKGKIAFSGSGETPGIQ